jgi:hypothetical protein
MSHFGFKECVNESINHLLESLTALFPADSLDCLGNFVEVPVQSSL